jgi:rhodanese-related sulfurtransferase
MSFARKLFFTLLAAAILVPAIAPAAEKEFRVVSTAELKSLMDEKKAFVLVDTRTSEEFQEAHIKGAVSIPEKNFEAQLSLLPADRNALVVLYCNGVKCGKSKKAAKKAEAAGYSNLVPLSPVPSTRRRSRPPRSSPPSSNSFLTQRARTS